MGTADTTTDPAPSPRRPRSAASRPALEIAFHSDLRRIGERFELESGEPATVGRLEPLFGAPDSTTGPLADPCVSRDQLSVRWLEGEGAFEVAPGQGARRPLIRLDSGERLERATRLPPETLIAIGDRAVLRVTLSPAPPGSDGDLLGGSEAMALLRERIETFAQSDATLLITGETGSGKELVARSVHAASARREQPFVAVNCAALPETLLESELFGHVPGAFTGATHARSGVFRAAESGTVLLDEVAELPAAAQAKLLRVLGDGSLRVVGRETETRVRCRVIAATHRNLAHEVRAGRFRQDLHMRLSGCEIAVPALRERRSDVPLLFARFLVRALEQLGQPGAHGLVRVADRHAPPVPLEFIRALARHDWPGNVRELERLAAACAALSARAGAFVEPPFRRDASAGPIGGSESRPDRDQLRRLLREHGYVQRRVAGALGVPYATLDRWLRDHDIPRARDLGAGEIRGALGRVDGDVKRAAGLLEVSARGLRRRVNELGLADTLSGDDDRAKR